jgi:tRNA(Ile)-lysidine synthase
VLTVDHGLRPEARAEAAFVADVAGRLGVEARVLRWEGPHPASGIEAAAREARYRLLTEAARAAGAAFLATAHHRDDQAETFLLRLARGSGAYGLAAMAAELPLRGVVLVRPLLALSRADLAATVRAAGLDPVDDPHNRDPRFARTRMRALLAGPLAAEGLDAERLAGTADRLRRAADAIDLYVDRLFRAAAKDDALGAVLLDAGRWSDEPAEARLRALSRILRAVGGAPYAPRLERLEAMEAAMLTAFQGGGLRRTLGGVLVDHRKGRFRFQREAGREGLPVIEVEREFDGVWDGRFAIRLTVEGAPVSIGPLGEGGRRRLKICVEDALPRALEAVPAVRRGEAILAAPALGLLAPSDAGIALSVQPLVSRRLMEPSSHDFA